MAYSRSQKLKFNAVRLGRFVKMLAKNKKGVVGLAILVAFIILALVPQFFTPYQPIDTTGLSGSMSAPLWLRYLPGGDTLGENIVVVPNPGFDTPSSLNDFNYVSEEPELIRVWHSSSFGYGKTYGNGPGCLAITYGVSDAPAENATVDMERAFVYPYSGTPERFTGDIAVFVSGTSRLGTRGDITLLVPAKVTVFIRNEAGTVFDLWTTDLISGPASDWKITRTSSQTSDLDSRSEQLKIFMYGMIYDNASRMWMPYIYRYPVYPEKDVFGSKPQNMTLGVEITFLGNSTINDAETTVFIDGLYFRAYGTAWGMLGTDTYGRDLFAQLIYGVRLSLYIGLLASFIGVVLGLTIGLAAGYLGKAVDELLMRFADALLVIPGLPLLIVLIAVLGATINNLIILLGLLGWMGFARTVRSQVLSLRERPFIEAAKAAGAGKLHIMTKHVLPNVMSLVYVTLATSVPGAVVAEASLSWLGFYDPTVMSWGRMLNAVQFEASGAYDKWWWALPPGLCIAILALSFILIGFSMDEVLNPRLRARA
jgi:ABC-type dipeptide/oligopeptide/nickel transport system permease subunit